MSVLPLLVNGSAGGAWSLRDGRPFAVLCFAVAAVKIVEIDLVTMPERLATLGLDGILRAYGLG